MPRKPRDKSPTHLYHVTLRGNGKQLIFEDDEDRLVFLDTVTRSFAANNITLIAWCLMGNHVHLAIYDPNDGLSASMQSITTSYAMKFNKKTGHSGHVFQDRFGTSPILSEEHLYQAIKYIHLNPEKAGIAEAASYFWSSNRQYQGIEDEYCCVDSNIVDQLFSNPQRYLRFMSQERSTYRPQSAGRRSEKEAIELAAAIAKEVAGVSLDEVKAQPKPLRNRVLSKMREQSIPIRQIQRFTGIGEWTIRKA